MKFCPSPQIKNSDHFKNHVEALGEPLTYLVYDKNGGNLLSEGKTAALYKQILDKTNNELLTIKLTAKVFSTAIVKVEETKEPVKSTSKPQRGRISKGEDVKRKDPSSLSSMSPLVIKQGVDFVFEQNPELAKIGTPQQYSQYLDTIFPDSKVKDILWHSSSSADIEKFDFKYFGSNSDKGMFGIATYLEANREDSTPYNRSGLGKTYGVVVNIQNSARFNEITDYISLDESDKSIQNKKDLLHKNNDSAILGNWQYAIFNNDNTYILGSKQDIEEFKEFVKEQPSSSPSENLSISSFTLYDNLQQENDIVNSLTSMALKFIDENKKGQIPTKLTDVIEDVKQDIQTDYEFFNYYAENVPDTEDIENGAHQSIEENKSMADKLKFVLDNFDQVKEGDKIKYVGLRTRMENKINSLKFSVNEDLIGENENGLDKENFEDSWALKISSENSMSAQVKRLLSYIPARDYNGNIKSTTLGHKVYEDYIKVFSLVQNSLTDIPIEYIYDELKELATKNVIIKDVLVALDKLAETSPEDYYNFHVTMRRQEANFFTILANPKDNNKKSSYQVFNTNQANAADNVINIWHENFKVTGIKSGLITIDEETGALITNIDKAKEISKKFMSNFKMKNLDDRFKVISEALNDIGIEITPEDLAELNRLRQLYNGEIKGEEKSKGRTNNYSKHYKEKTFNRFASEQLKPIFSTLTGELKDKDESSKEIWELRNPFFFQESRIKGLTPYYLAKNPDVANSATFRNGNGDLIQGIMMPTFASNRVFKLMNDDKLKQLYDTIPFTKHNTWLDRIRKNVNDLLIYDKNNKYKLQSLDNKIFYSTTNNIFITAENIDNWLDNIKKDLEEQTAGGTHAFLEELDRIKNEGKLQFLGIRYTYNPEDETFLIEYDPDNWARRNKVLSEKTHLSNIRLSLKKLYNEIGDFKFEIPELNISNNVVSFLNIKEKPTTVVRMGYFDSANMRKSQQDSKNYTDQSPTEKEYTKIALFQNSGRNRVYTIGNTPSDKTMFKLFEVDKHNLNLDGRDNLEVFAKGIVNKESINLESDTMKTLYNLLVQSEVNRIISVRRAFKEKNYQDLIPGYHYFEKKNDKGKIIQIIGAGGYFYFIPELNTLLDDYIQDGEFNPGSEGITKFKEILRDKLVQLTEDKVQSWNEKGIVDLNNNTHNFDKSYAYGIGEKIEKNNSERNIINKAAADMVINYMINYANEFQLITGDPALFAKPSLLFTDWKGLLANTADNIFKRTAKDIAPGLEGLFGSATFKSLFINEPNVASLMRTYEERLGIKLAKKYGKISKEEDKDEEDLAIADAQEWITLKEHLNTLHAYGKISKQVRDNLIKKAEQRLVATNKKEFNFTWEELATVLQPVKPVYVSSKYNEELEVNEEYYIKTSSYPLIPQLTERLEIDKFRIAMETNKIDRAVVNSGVKLGFTKGTTIFDKNGDVNIPENLSEFVHDLPRDGFRIQQEIPYDILKEKILEGSQLRKLQFANLTPDMNFNYQYGDNKTHKGYQLKELSDRVHNRLYQLRYEQLLKDLGVPEGENTITDVNKLKQVLIETAESLNYNVNDILLLTNTITLNGSRVIFEVPLFLHNQSDKIESMLNSIIKNRVLMNKLPGRSYVQGSSVGFNTTYKMGNKKFLDTMMKTSEASIAYTTDANGKPYFQGNLDYREYEENGQKIIYAEVFAPFNFVRDDKKVMLKDYVDDAGFIKEDKLDKELLNILGYRIPTQGHSSMMKMKVVGFLPQEAGDLIIVPAAITKQMGSDFDVDKLYTHSFNYKFALGSRIEKVKYSTKEEDFDKLSEKELQNMLVDITFSILDNTDIQNKYQFVLTDDPTLKDDKKAINKLKENIPQNTLRIKPNKSSLLYDEYQAHMVEVNAAGKIGIGSYSSASSNHILFQYAGVYLKVPISPKGKLLYDKAISVKFKDENNQVFTDKLDGDEFKYNRVNNINTVNYIDAIGDGAWRLDKVYTFKTNNNPNGKLISEVIKSYQSSSVDNAKDQNLFELHQNKHTFSVSWLIARVGFEEQFIDRFISQPAIVKYVKGLNNLDNYVDTEFDPIKKLKLQRRLFEELGQNFDEWSYGITAPSIAEMETAIKDNGADKLFQAQMLWNFIKYGEVASEISRVQTSINTDTAFLGKSLYESILKQSILLEDKQFLGNTKNLTNGTTQEGAKVYGLDASVDLFANNNLYPIRSNVVLGIFDEISKELDKDLREDIAYKVFSDIRASLFTSVIKEAYDKDINTVREELLFGGNSVGKRLRAIQATTTNTFFKVLSVKTGNTATDPDLVEFNASKELRQELDMSMLIAWNKALNSSNEAERQLAEDLVLYTLVIGNQRLAKDFGKFLPYDYIVEKLAPYYRKLDFNNPQGTLELLAANFTTQWLQHNPYRNRDTKPEHWESSTKFDGSQVKGGEVPDIITLKSLDNEDVKQLVSYNNGNTIRKPKMLLYKYEDTKGKSQIALFKQEGKEYVRVPVLGYTQNIKEYNVENPNQQSVFRDKTESVEKKVTVTLEPKLPETKKEKDLFDSYNYNGGIESVLESIVENGTNSKYKAIAKFYLKHKDLIKQYKLDFFDSKRDTNLQDINDNYNIGTDDGKIWYNDVIILNKDNIKDSVRFERVFLHEITHALVYARLGKDHKANKELQSIMDELKEHQHLLTDVKWLESIGVTKIGKMYGSDKTGYVFGDYIFTDTQEFAAALMTDKDLYRILYNIPYDKDKSFWDKIREFIVQLLGFDTGDTLLTEGMATVLQIIDSSSFSKEIAESEFEQSLSPSEKKKVYPMKPVDRVFKLAIDKDGHYIPEIASSENKRRIVNEYFRFRGSQDFNSKNKPYTTFTKGNAQDDIKLVHEINNQYTGRVVAYNPPTGRIVFTSDEADYKLKGSQLEFEFSSSPMESTVNTETQKLINIKKTQLEIFKARLTEKGVNREELKKRISILEAQIEKLTIEDSQKVMEEITKKTLESVTKTLDNIQEDLNGNPSEEKLYQIFNDLRDLDVYVEGMLHVDELIEYPGKEATDKIAILQADILRERKRYFEQYKQALTQLSHIVGSQRFSDISEEELFTDVEDITFLVRETLSMADSPSMLVRLNHQIIHLAKQRILEKQREIATSVDNWKTKLEKHTKLDAKGVIDIFKQKYEDGSWTGNYISKYKQEFFDHLFDMTKRVKSGEMTAKQAFEWRKNNTTTITVEEIESRKSDIFTKEEIDRQNELIELYNEDKNAFEEGLRNTYLQNGVVDEKIVEEKLTVWEFENNPKEYLKNYHNNKISNFKFKGYKYLIYPKPKDKWLDKRFDKIQNDPVLLEFYNFMVDTFKENNKSLPFMTEVPGNYLPEASKTFMQKIKDSSFLDSFSVLGDEFWNAITDEVEGEVDYTLRLGNRKFKVIPTRMMMNKLDAKDKSDDIFKILKAHTTMANSYKFKSQIEPILTSSQQYLDEINEISKRDTVKGKVPTKNMWKEVVGETGKLVNTKKQFEHQIESFLYENYRDVEGRIGKVFLSEKDKVKKAELDKLLEEDKITPEQYQTRISTLGRQITATGIMDVVNKYTYLKALGLPNFATPTVNLTFGLASNLTYAAGNQGTTLKDMRKAIGMTMNSILTRKGVKKLWAFMEELGILDEYNESLYGDERTIVDQMAFILQTQTEKLNRGTMMLAHLLTLKVKNKQGQDVSVYYAFKEIDGKLVWDTENFGEREEVDAKTSSTEHGVNMYRLKTLISKVNQRVHGDYETALRAKRTIVGRSLFMFKTWLAMSVVERFGKEDFDDDLGRSVKGRYTVVWTAKDAEGNEISMQKFFGILTKAAISKEGLSGLSELDRASVRRNLKELQFIAQFAIAVAALSLVAKGGDDDDEYKFALNTAINILTKAQADMAFFITPSAWAQFTNNFIPITSSVTDIFKFVPVVMKTVSGSPSYESGPLEDQNRILMWGAQVTPGVNAGVRIWKNGVRVIEQF